MDHQLSAPGAPPHIDPPGGAVDLANCAREPIHTPGAVQPHGAVLVIDAHSGAVIQTSAHARTVMGLAPEDILGLHLSELCGEVAARELHARAVHQTGTALRPMRIDIAGVPLDAHAYVPADGLIGIDVERATARSIAAQDVAARVSDWTARLQHADTIDAVLDCAAEVLHHLTGFDRAWAYRFADDDHGIVVAEHRSADIESFLGLHFPESDIPAQARELYRRYGTRVIIDSHAEAVGLVPRETPDHDAWLDLSRSGLRAVSPIHLRYLRNMGVRSSLSVPIVVDGRLFGLLSAHNYGATRPVPVAMRAECEALGVIVAMRVGSVLELEDARTRAGLRDSMMRILASLARHEAVADGIVGDPDALLAICDATGALAMVEPGKVRSVGRVPSAEAIATFAEALPGLWDADGTFSATTVSDQVPGLGGEAATAAGVLAVSLGRDRWLAWLRPEVVEEVTWGNRDKGLALREPSGELRLGYRESFERWVDEVSGGARPWSVAELEAVRTLRASITSFLVGHTDRLARLNDELRRSNAELDAFAYAAAHDLRVPTHTIERLCRLVVDRTEGRLEPAVADDLRLAADLAGDMESLLRSLLEYAKVGAAPLERVPLNLRAVTGDVVRMLGARVPPDAVIVAEDRTVEADAVGMRQLLLNLLWNAIKYSEGAPQIHVGSSDEAPGRLFVRDQGIGIAPQHHERVFELFQRLHPSGAHGGGDGAGLAVCRRIVERHGGRIWIESELGAGTTVWWTLTADG